MFLNNPALLGVIERLKSKQELQKTLSSFSWMMGERLVSLTLALFINIPVARYLGPENLGLLNYVLAIGTLVAPLAAMGLENIVTKELMENPHREGHILGTVATLRKMGALVATVLVMAWALLTPQTDPRMPLYIALVVGAGLIASFNFLQHWFLANQVRSAYSISLITNTVVFSAIRIGLVFAKAPLVGFMVLAALEVLFSGIAIYVAHRIARKGPIAWKWDGALARKLLAKSWPLTISGLSAAVYLRLDIIMLAHYGSMAEAGIYSVAARLSEIWYFVPTLLMTALFPSLLNFKKRSSELYNRRIQDILDVCAAAGMLIAVLMSIAAPFVVNLLYGAKFGAAAPILAVHVWSGIFIFMRALLSKWLIAEDLYIFSLVTHASGAVANVILNIILIPRLGGLGAAIATLISYALASYFSLLFHSKTRPMFLKMTLGLLWPRRLPELGRALSKLRQHPST